LTLYLSGDEEKLVEKSMESLESSDALSDKYLDVLMTSRNIRMADRIAQKLRANPGKSYFFAIGAGHYPGTDGIVALLQQKGFSVSRVVPATDEEKARWAAPSSGSSSSGLGGLGDLEGLEEFLNM
jgi:uncharacterized protein YbaP (TraB family)